MIEKPALPQPQISARTTTLKQPRCTFTVIWYIVLLVIVSCYGFIVGYSLVVQPVSRPGYFEIPKRFSVCWKYYAHCALVHKLFEVLLLHRLMAGRNISGGVQDTNSTRRLSCLVSLFAVKNFVPFHPICPSFKKNQFCTISLILGLILTNYYFISGSFSAAQDFDT